ncbi:MAG TPA: ribosome maturation factor RimP [Clostridia bacterium]|nr:ribosome maturation factor RimP [Clostridia bacterium]
MARGDKVTDIVENLAEPTADLCGVEVVDVEFVKEGANWFLRIYIDAPGGVTLDHCERFSKEIDMVLDEKDPIKQSYHLEVSSPGLERPIKKEKDFLRFKGSTIKVKTFASINNQKNFTGIIKDTESHVLVLDVDGREVNIPLEQIAKARLVPDFDW